LAAVLGDLVARHEALRTTFAHDGGGSLRQILHGSGSVRVRHVEAGRDEATGAAEAALAADRTDRFDLGAEPPIRVIAVGSEGTVYAVALVVSHITSDGGGMEVLVDDLRRLAAHRRRDPSRVPPRPEGRSPREQAKYEAGPAALRRSAAAQEQWRAVLAEAPAHLLPPVGAEGGPSVAGSDDERIGDAEPDGELSGDTGSDDVETESTETAQTGDSVPGPWREARLSGPAVDLASRWLAAQWNRTPGAVVLAAFCAAFTELTGQDPVALKVILGNRISAAQRTAVGSFAQNGLVCLRSADATLEESAARADAALLASARHGHYDPVAMQALVDKAGADRGEQFELTAYFNDFRPAAPAPVARRIAELEAGAVRWGGGWAKQDSLLFFEVWQEGAVPLTRLLADTRRLPEDRIERLLLGVQDVLLRAARGTSGELLV
jgi:hypothetical protein